MPPIPCDCCDKKCNSHESNTEKLVRHETDITSLERTTQDVSIRLSSLEGKFGTFTWVCGTLLTVLVGLSVYAILQLQGFEKEYYKELLNTRSMIIPRGTH